MSPSTVLNIHGGFHTFRDTSHFATDFDPEWRWDGVFPGADFYKPVFADPSVPNLIPRMTVNGSTHMGPGGGYWHETPHAWEISAKLSQQHGNHYLKMGVDVRSATTNSLLVDVIPASASMGSRPRRPITIRTCCSPVIPTRRSFSGAITPTISGDDGEQLG